jgi:hypothetical protein
MADGSPYLRIHREGRLMIGAGVGPFLDTIRAEESRMKVTDAMVEAAISKFDGYGYITPEAMREAIEAAIAAYVKPIMAKSARARSDAITPEQRMNNMQYIVICQQIICSPGLPMSTAYNWDGERFNDRNKAIRHGNKIRGSDDFNIGVIIGKKLVSFDWMHTPIEHDLSKIQEQLYL